MRKHENSAPELEYDVQQYMVVEQTLVNREQRAETVWTSSPPVLENFSISFPKI